jgi:hypothetical protein
VNPFPIQDAMGHKVKKIERRIINIDEVLRTDVVNAFDLAPRKRSRSSMFLSLRRITALLMEIP